MNGETASLIMTFTQPQRPTSLRACVSVSFHPNWLMSHCIPHKLILEYCSSLTTDVLVSKKLHCVFFFHYTFI